ncbi:hypothetical protein [Desulfoscipio gibsoniae]
MANKSKALKGGYPFAIPGGTPLGAQVTFQQSLTYALFQGNLAGNS